MKDVIKHFYRAYKKIPRVLTLAICCWKCLQEMTFFFLRSLAQKMLDTGDILWSGKHSSPERPVKGTVWRRKNFFCDSFEDEEGRGTAGGGVHRGQLGAGHTER